MASSSSDVAPPGNMLRRLLKYLSKLGSYVDKGALEKATCFVESAKLFLKWNARLLVSNAAATPVAVVYSGDGTPIETRQRATVRMDNSKVVRSGYCTQEYYIQQAMYRYIDADGTHHTALMLADPYRLLYGKASCAQMSLALAFSPTLREMGHRGIAISLYAYDRAFLSPNSKVHAQYHQEVHSKLTMGDVGKCPTL